MAEEPSWRPLASGMIVSVVDANDVRSLSARDALALYTTFTERGIRCWVMGGWGVAALLGAQARPHHDLDLLVCRADLGVFLPLLAELGFSEKLVWGESLWIGVDGVVRPTAFVQADVEGRELDVHVIELMDGRAPIALCDVPWEFDEASLTATGVIDGHRVDCVSAETQLQMHTGYDLPPEHRSDAERLASFLVNLARPDA